MTTAAEIITRVLNPLRDAAQDFFPDPELIEYMNQAVVDLSARQRLFRDAADLTVTSGHIDMTSDMLQIRWAKDDEGIEVSWMDESTFFEYELNFPDWDSAQPLATVFSDAIWIHPAPADGTVYTVGYYGLPAVLTADTDTFPLRRIWEEKVVRYIRSECWYKLGEPGMGDRERQFYEEGLRPSEAITDHQVPGRMNFAREPNVWDSHPESIHQGG